MTASLMLGQSFWNCALRLLRRLSSCFAARSTASTCPTFIREKRPSREQAARRDDLLVQPVAVAADDDQPGMGDDRGRVERFVRHDPGRDPVQPLARRCRDQTSARSSRRLIWTSRWFRWTSTTSSRPAASCVVEDDRADLLRVRMLQPLRAARPACPAAPAAGRRGQSRLPGIVRLRLPSGG